MKTLSSFGSGGLFLCYVLTMLFLTMAFGWPALVILNLVTIGYAALLDLFPLGMLNTSAQIDRDASRHVTQRSEAKRRFISEFPLKFLANRLPITSPTG